MWSSDVVTRITKEVLGIRTAGGNESTLPTATIENEGPGFISLPAPTSALGPRVAEDSKRGKRKSQHNAVATRQKSQTYHVSESSAPVTKGRRSKRLNSKNSSTVAKESANQSADGNIEPLPADGMEREGPVIDLLLPAPTSSLGRLVAKSSKRGRRKTRYNNIGNRAEDREEHDMQRKERDQLASSPNVRDEREIGEARNVDLNESVATSSNKRVVFDFDLNLPASEF